MPRKKFEKERAEDRARYGLEGIEYGDRYIDVGTCFNIVKLYASGSPLRWIAAQFEMEPGIITLIVASYRGYIVQPTKLLKDLRLTDIQEYQEIQTIKDRRQLKQEDMDDILIDLYLLGKGGTNESGN